MHSITTEAMALAEEHQRAIVDFDMAKRKKRSAMAAPHPLGTPRKESHGKRKMA